MPAMDEALELLRKNDYHELLRSKANFIRGPLTWASVCAVAVATVAAGLLDGALDKAIDVADDAHTLAERLRERDQNSSARVTAQLRQRIGMLDGLASCFEAAVALRDGGPIEFEALGRLVALRTRWFALRREMGSEAESDWVVALVQAAVGKVLTSDAGAGAKNMASRALAAWVATDPSAASVAADAPDAAASDADAPAAHKRLKLSEGPGEAVSWDDDL